MAVHNLTDEPGTGTSDVLALDGVAVGTGASIVVAVAATIALVLTVLVATLSSVVSATAMPSAHGTGRVLAANFETVGYVAKPVPAAYRIVDLAPPRDGTFAVVSPAPDGQSLAPLVVAGLLMTTLAAATQVVRALLAGQALSGRPRRTVRAGNHAPRA